MWRMGFGLVLVLVVAACAPAVSPTLEPTQTLLSPTLMQTAPPVTPTATTAAFSAIEAGVTLVPDGVSLAADAAPLVELARADLAALVNAAPESLQVLSAETAVWNNVIDLGCGDDSMPAIESAPVPGYRLVLAYDTTAYEYHTDTTDRVRLCHNSALQGGSALILTDPIGAELVGLARRELATSLGISEQRVRLIDAQVVVWEDTSLGCPVEGAVYSSEPVDGYRIVLAFGDEEYVYHTNFDRAVACEAEDEVLPEATAE